MEIGHSRLLRYLLPNNPLKPMMAEQQELRVEYISAPTDVESAVPNQQTLREPSKDIIDDQLEKTKDDDSTFVPVLTTKKEEAVFTKGDMKLQKVSVTEDISKKELVNPMYSEIHSEVIKNEQPMRTVSTDDVQNVEEPVANKPRSKIPMFRQKAEKVKQQISDTKTRKLPARKHRRSSIPKLKKNETPSNKESDKTSLDNTHKSIGQEKNKIVPPDEEFDKIFDEIVHNKEEPFNANVLGDSFEDAEKLEHSFDEIMHDYEENKIQPLDVNHIKLKIPYRKHKSLPEVKFERKLERRSSLKDIPIDNNDTTTHIILKGSEVKDIKNESNENNEVIKQKPSVIKSIELKSDELKSNGKTTEVKSTIKVADSELTHNQHIIPKDENKIKDVKLDYDGKSIEVAPIQNKNGGESLCNLIDKIKEDENSFPNQNTLSGNESLTDCNIEKSNDTINETEIKRTRITHIPKLRGKVSLPTNKFTTNEYSSTTPPKHENSNERLNKKSVVPKENIFNSNLNIEKNKSLDTSKEDTHIDIAIENKFNDIPLDSFADEQSNKNNLDLVIQITDLNKPSIDDNKESDEEDIGKLSALASKIRRDSVEKLKFERSESMNSDTANSSSNKLKPNSSSVTPPNTPQVHDYEPYKDSAHLAGEPKILNIDDVNEFNTNEKNIMLNEKSVRLTIPGYETPQIGSNDKHNFEDKSAKSRPSKYTLEVVNTQPDNSDDQVIDSDSPNPEFDKAPLFEAINKKMDTETKISGSMKGKVSNIINRIDSVESTPDTPKTRIDIPPKKSVSSRIAMFERQTSTPSEPKSKLEVVLDTKPKIIEEVLKTQPRRSAPFKNENFELKKETDSDEHKPHRKGSVDDNVDNLVKTKNIEHVARIFEIKDVIQQDVPLQSHLSENASINDIITEVANENNVTHIIEDKNNFHDKIKLGNELSKDKEAPKNRKNKISVSGTKEKFEILKSRESGIISRSKSVAELDLGDAVKGKVHQMIVRMNSVEKIELEKKFDHINIRERPRKKSVSEKIALFEDKKLTTFSWTSSGKDRENLSNVSKREILQNRNRDTRIDRESAIGSVIRSSGTSETETHTGSKETAAKNPTPEKNPVEKKDSVDSETPPPENTPAPEPAPIPEPEPIPVPDPVKEKYYKEQIEALQNAKIKYGRMEDMMYIKLSNGQDLPVMVLGTALMDPILLPHIIGAAIDLGYRGIDTAYIYGNEKEIGLAIKAKIDDGTVRREHLFITGKLWSTFHRENLVEKACLASLEALGLDYFDLYLIHNPMSFKEGGSPIPMIANVLQYSDTDYLHAWYGMEGLVAKGLAKGIGLSNFNSEQVAKVVNKGKIKPVVNQVECHPYLTQQRLDQFCSDRHITLQCYGTLGSAGTPADYKDSQDAVIRDPLVKVMAAGLNITPAQLLLRYQLECGHGVVTKCSSADRLWDNLQAQSITLAPAEVDALHALNRNKRTYAFKGMGDTHRNYPFKIPF